MGTRLIILRDFRSASYTKMHFSPKPQVCLGV